MGFEFGPFTVHFNGKYLGTMNNGTNYSLTNLQVFANQVEMVKELAKSGSKLQDEATPLKMHLNHMVIGLVGEVGEIADAVKKYTMYNKQLDTDNVKEEIGDLVFYILGLCQELSIDLFECMVLNQEKLKKKRYKDGYSDQAAIDRADKKTVCNICKGDGYSRLPSLGYSPCEVCEGLGVID